jgi:hypothetical protein
MSYVLPLGPPLSELQAAEWARVEPRIQAPPPRVGKAGVNWDTTDSVK